MISILLASSQDQSLSGIESCLKEKKDCEILRSTTGQDALNILSSKAIDLIVADETLRDMTGLELIKKMISKHPMTNSALVSSLSSKEFHEISEGLGILMHLPVRPDENHGEILINKLQNVLNLFNQ